MKAKEKAIALVDLYYDDVDNRDYNYDEPKDEDEILNDAKRICRKHINEMIDECRKYNSERESYWVEVKQELKQL